MILENKEPHAASLMPLGITVTYYYTIQFFIC